MTVNELICSQILSSYNEMTRNKQIPPIAPYPREFIQKFDEMLHSPQTKMVEFMIDIARHPVIEQRKMFLCMKKELKKFGVKDMQSLSLQDRAHINKIMEKNFGPKVK